MKRLFSIALLLFLSVFLVQAKENPFAAPGNYKLIVEGFDWGPAVSKVVLSLDQPMADANANDFEIYVSRSSSLGELPEAVRNGKRTVLFTYPSDANGTRMAEGKFLTLVLAVSPNNPIASSMQYMRIGSRAANNWIDYQMTVVHSKSGKIWNESNGILQADLKEFDLTGKFTHGKVSLTYGSFAPKNVSGKAPLIIWLHGGGEGGTDPSIALLGNKAYNYASPEIQVLFGGAYVLAPQTPTFWMDAGEGMTRGQVNDIYNEAVFALIQDFVAKNPGVDPTRIYVGGCSNGGYISLKLIFEHPDYFAAGYISALAYNNEFVTDQMIQKIKNVPIWFVHAKNDPTTKAPETVIPIYDRLKQAGAKNVYLSLYDTVHDITGLFGGEDFRYNDHWSWIYSHANVARLDRDGSPVMLNGKPVSIMEWMAAQKKKK
ncbi:prolyl oligopeptidase family protein [Algoriphagus boseongensis]|uniref:Prolyl oligopeptidase family protein n=1 Tax=Algoriphagus boseongensis TaxID=1442587 RepID=A0A4R6T783_9BACT|nr:prolyl oligopeptidase family serine peptidase [Algoriphagus boseongensis]TDQ18511.1 prolyl oligopeptidase family protein [Algoriphagus boseongensis]